MNNHDYTLSSYCKRLSPVISVVTLFVLTLHACNPNNDCSQDEWIAAIRIGNERLIAQCLEEGVNPDKLLSVDENDPRFLGSRQVTPLSYLIASRHFDAVGLLLKNNADPNTKSANGKPSLFWATESGEPALVAQLVDGGAKVDLRDDNGLTALAWAAIQSRDTMIEELLAVGANPNLPDNDGNAPLHLASAKGDVSITLNLLNNGANFDMHGQRGQTPLMFASSNSHIEVMRLLVNAGADVNQMDDVGHMNALMWAAASPDPANTLKCLLDAGADPNARGYRGETALHHAVMYGSKESVCVLLSGGADITIENDNGESSVELAESGKIAEQREKLMMLREGTASIK